LRQGNKTQKSKGFTNLIQGNIINKANNYPGLQNGRAVRKNKAEEWRVNKAGVSVPTYELRAGHNGEQEQWWHIKLGITKRLYKKKVKNGKLEEYVHSD